LPKKAACNTIDCAIYKPTGVISCRHIKMNKGFKMKERITDYGI